MKLPLWSFRFLNKSRRNYFRLDHSLLLCRCPVRPNPLSLIDFFAAAIRVNLPHHRPFYGDKMLGALWLGAAVSWKVIHDSHDISPPSKTIVQKAQRQNNSISLTSPQRIANYLTYLRLLYLHFLK